MTKIPDGSALRDPVETGALMQDRSASSRGDRINASQAGSLPGVLDFQWTEAGKSHIRGRFHIAERS